MRVRDPSLVSVQGRLHRPLAMLETIMRSLVRVILVLALGMAGVAHAHAQYYGGGYRGYYGGPRITFGIGVGPFYGYGPYFPYSRWGYPYPAYPSFPAYPAYPAYPPTVIVTRPAPTVYIERPVEAVEQVAAPAGYWYWCADSQGWYPTVPECRSGWQAVAPRPAQ
jgi:hypothetical protein